MNNLLRQHRKKGKTTIQKNIQIKGLINMCLVFFSIIRPHAMLKKKKKKEVEYYAISGLTNETDRAVKLAAAAAATATL